MNLDAPAPLQCTPGALQRLDTQDLDAVQALLDTCLRTLLDPTLWAWAIGLTLLFTAIGGLIGWLRGRPIAGLVWGAALGPIGWLVVALLPARTIDCPECAHPNHTGAKRCGHCGVDLQRAARTTARSRLRAARNDGGR